MSELRTNHPGHNPVVDVHFESGDAGNFYGAQNY